MYEGKLYEETINKLEEYKKAFQEGFPLMQFDGETNEELIAEIEKCIKTKKKYDTSFWDKHSDYDD